jgi:hypothetical protein
MNRHARINRQKDKHQHEERTSHQHERNRRRCGTGRATRAGEDHLEEGCQPEEGCAQGPNSRQGCQYQCRRTEKGSEGRLKHFLPTLDTACRCHGIAGRSPVLEGRRSLQSTDRSAAWSFVWPFPPLAGQPTSDQEPGGLRSQSSYFPLRWHPPVLQHYAATLETRNARKRYWRTRCPVVLESLRSSRSVNSETHDNGIDNKGRHHRGTVQA